MANCLGSISISSHLWASLSCQGWTTVLAADLVPAFTGSSGAYLRDGPAVSDAPFRVDEGSVFLVDKAKCVGQDMNALTTDASFFAEPQTFLQQFWLT